MLSTYISKLPVENNPNSYYYVKIQFFSKNFSISIVDGSEAFEGELTDSYIAEQSKIFNLTDEEYFEEYKNVFKNSSNENLYTYNIGDGYFHIKKKLASNAGIKVKFGVIKLHQVPYSNAMKDFLNMSLRDNETYLQKIKNLKEENIALSKEKISLTLKFEELQKDRKLMELTLYRKFINLLNSKKDKIKQLQQKLGIELQETNSPNIIEDNNMEIETETTKDIYDADTDVDEEVEEKTVVIDEVKLQEKKPHDSEWGKKLICNTDVQSIMSSMTFLDPTVPYDS